RLAGDRPTGDRRFPGPRSAAARPPARRRSGPGGDVLDAGSRARARRVRPMTDPAAVLRVVVVDDQALVRSGFSMILGVEPDLKVVGEASDGMAAVDVVTRLRPDVVLMDVQMPGTDGIEATREIVARDLAKVIILTTFDR